MSYKIVFQLGVAVYRKFWYQTLHNINFDNPVYRFASDKAFSSLQFEV